jgi:hypothetical protein
MALALPVAAPTRPDRLGGIRKVATWVEDARIGAAETVVFQSDGCTFPQLAIGLCYGETTVTEKAGVGIANLSGIGAPFAMYGGIKCFLGPDSDLAERARNVLIDGEDRMIEDRLEAYASAGTALAAGTTLVGAVANIEQNMDDVYLGRGYLLMARGDAVRARAQGAIIDPGLGDLPTTINGTPVVASGRVAAGTVYGLGATTVLRSSVTTIEALDPRSNDEWQIAEAVYAIVVDCAYRVKSTGV